MIIKEGSAFGNWVDGLTQMHKHESKSSIQIQEMTVVDKQKKTRRDTMGLHLIKITHWILLFSCLGKLMHRESQALQGA